MLDKLLYDLAEKIVGKNGEAIIDILKDKRDVNEFKIAEKLKLTINQVRNILYKLDAHDIVSFIRKKDKQKGWYIYYWSLDTLKALKLLAKMKEKEIGQLNQMLKSHENKRFFFCKDCNLELTEETALTHDFTCPECGNLLQLQEMQEKILEIKKGIGGKSRILGEINKEIENLSIEKSKKESKKKVKVKKKKIKVKKKKAKKRREKRKVKSKIKKSKKK